MKILVLINSDFVSGAEKSILEYIEESTNLYDFYFCISRSNITLQNSLSEYKTIQLPLIWMSVTYNPLKLIRYLFNIIYVSIKIKRIVVENEIDIIYSNTIKSQVYLLIAKIFINKPVVWHVRDNIKSGFLSKIMSLTCERLVCVSEHIYNQFLYTAIRKKCIVYGGISLKKWNLVISDNFPVYADKIDQTQKKIIVAKIGQITRWKNQIDFIKLAYSVLKENISNVHFLIVGDTNSNRDEHYLNELKKEIEYYKLSESVSIIRNVENINEFYSKIDILVHTSIDEPFGRVIVEAMAMEKPVIAYNCGGPKEIIVDRVTGYLVEPHDIENLSDKTIHLLKNEDVRLKFGSLGRVRVKEKFSIERYFKEMEIVFNSI